MKSIHRAGLLLAILCLAACSPALNWRTLPLDGAGLDVQWPCKPESAERSIPLGNGALVKLAMAGCEADGALLTVSHLRLEDPTQAGAVLSQWQDSVRSRIGAADEAPPAPFALPGSVRLPASQQLLLRGQRPDGTAVAAQAAWFVRIEGAGMRLYHAVVYSSRARPDVGDTFFAGLVLR